jgi:hypothetical protein
VLKADAAERENQTDMTLLLDGWSNQCMNSLMGWLLRTRDGRVQVLALTNISEDAHTAIKLSGAHLQQ